MKLKNIFLYQRFGKDRLKKKCVYKHIFRLIERRQTWYERNVDLVKAHAVQITEVEKKTEEYRDSNTFVMRSCRNFRFR